MFKDSCTSISKRVGMEAGKLKSAITGLSLDLRSVEEHLGIKLGPRTLVHKKYENTVNNFLISYVQQDEEDAKEYLEKAARIRKCLG